MAATGKRKTAADRNREVRGRIMDAALELSAQRGWNRTPLPAVAAAADVTLAELYGHFRSRSEIVDGLFARVDAQVLADQDPDAAEESPRERLFDLLMRRFDALSAHKDGVVAMSADTTRDPVGLLLTCPSFMRSMALMLEAAGIPSAGIRGIMRTKGLALVYLQAFRTWAEDDSEDMGKTMAALDRALARAERAESLCAGFCTRRPRKSPDSTPEDPEAAPATP